MTTRTVERVDEWETTPFAGGYDGLRELAADEFSGVVTAGPARLCMLSGTVVGVLDGSIEDFDGADGTARRAPHHALPLLTYMQEVSDEVRAKYYSEDTPLSDVDRTLSEGNFTGYVELAENVLSGDYFQVYHQGRSMSVAFVGSSNRLLTDDEAFETADDEVGIYEVRPVEFEPIEIPGGETGAGDVPGAGTSADAGAGAGAGADAGTDANAGAGAGADPGDAVGSRDEAGVGAADARSDPSSGSAGSDAGSASAGDRGDRADAGRGADARGDRTDRNEPTDRSEPSGNGHSADASGGRGTGGREATGGSEATGGTGTERGGNAGRSSDETAGGTPASGEQPTSGTEDPSSAAGAGTPADSAAGTPASSEPDRSAERGGAPESGGADRSNGDPTAAAGESDPGNSVADAATDLETRSIPSLDPGRSRSSAGGGDRTGAGGAPPGSKMAAGGGRGGAAGRDAAGASGSEAPNSGASEAGAPEGAGTAREETPRDPERSGTDADGAGTADAEPTRSEGGRQSAAGGRQEASGRSETAGGAGGDPPETGGADAADEGAAAGDEPARERIEDREADVRELERELEALTEERDDIAAERDRLESELEDARAEIERLEARLAEVDDAGGTAGGTQLTADRAVDETNLFVRYDSKGEATLEKAHGGTVDRAAVAENLRLEYHTQFDADDATVAGEPFDDFLSGTIQYRFVEWLVTSLLWEIRDTGHVDGMKDLYDALPKIDRAELNGQVSVQFEDEGEEHRTQESFDVVVRDRMGNPLVVANINDSRDPATDSMMTDLVKASQRVGESSSSLAGAVLVTKSFFQPEALETAEEAASSGLFSRDKRESFVNLSRKEGFHLCLVEARNDEIHLTVPEL